MRLSFHGAVGTVTGSKYLLETDKTRVLVDCGLFQGLKELRERNWRPFPFEPSELDAVVLTHAHIDHSGVLPLLVKNGFRGPIYATPATIDLCALLLPDSGYLQEEEANFANRKGYSKHKPAQPLYTYDDAVESLKYLKPLPFDATQTVGDISFHFEPTGHILGAASAHFAAEGLTVVFSGDVGRQNDLLMHDPRPLKKADYLVIESTYGNRHHPDNDPGEELAAIVHEAVDAGGVLLIPSFAVGRTQLILHLLVQLKNAGKIPNVPIYIDSPMAINATKLYLDYHDEVLLSEDDCRTMCSGANYVNSVEESKALDLRNDAFILISASGMATGGRVLHHLKAMAPEPRNTVLFAGFQAAGTRGEAMINGAETIKIHGFYVPVKARIRQMESLSAHGDRDELVTWLKQIERRPRATFITHGEPSAADAFRRHLGDVLGFVTKIPRDGESVRLE